METQKECLWCDNAEWAQSENYPDMQRCLKCGCYIINKLENK